MKWSNLGDPHKGYAVHGYYPRRAPLFHGILVRPLVRDEPFASPNRSPPIISRWLSPSCQRSCWDTFRPSPLALTGIRLSSLLSAMLRRSVISSRRVSLHAPP